MTGAWRILRREFHSYAATPWLYGVAVAFLLLTGLTFFIVVDGTREATMRFWFPNLSYVLLVTVPVVTSRTLAEERRTRHVDVLLAHPVDPLGMVVGKWLAVCGLFAAFLAVSLVYVVFLAAWGSPDWPPLVASYGGALLSIALFGAVGTLTSAVTTTSVAAGLASFAILIGLQLADAVPGLGKLSFVDPLDSFSRGAPRLSDVVYFVSGTLLCLVLAGFSELARRTARWARAALVPGALVAGSLAANWAVLPVDTILDVTATGRYTLSAASRDVLRNLDGPARITLFEAANSPQARDYRVLLKEYARTSSKVSYRLRDFERYRGEAYSLGISDNGQAVVEVGERREVVDPIMELPVTSAIQRLGRARPQTLCALQGHGERFLDDAGPYGFDAARLAMESNGVETMTIDLTASQLIPPECTMIGLFGPTIPLRDPEVAALHAFLKADGKMIVLREPDGPDLDPLTQPFGLRFLPGVVVDPDRSVAGDPRALLINRFPTEAPIVSNVPGAALVTAGGVTTAASEEQGLSVARVLESTDASWLELSATEGRYEPEKGDRPGPVVIGGAADLSRLSATGESRVKAGGPAINRTRLIVIADVDWATATFLDELGNRRLLGNAVNWLAGEEDLLAVGGVNNDLRRLTLTSGRRQIMGWVSLGGLPGGAFLAGAALWIVRRRR